MNEPVRPAETAGIAHADMVKFSASHPGGDPRRAAVIDEVPLRIEVDGNVYTVMRTPGADRELVVGFLFTEGLIDGTGDITLLNQCVDSPDVIYVRTLSAKAKVHRTFVITSSCGLCGREDIEALLKDVGRVESDLRVSAQCLQQVSPAVRGLQPLFQLTGSAHAAALFDRAGRIHCVREDVGRHNALDKVIGHTLLHGRSFGEAGVFLSGRTSLELIIKAGRARIPIVAAVGAPTRAAIAAAEAVGVTLCGFVRDAEVNVYTHGWRVEADGQRQ
jgi:FdhD protein